MLNNISKNNELSILNKKKYWLATIKLTTSLLIIWFSASYGAGILFREKLDEYSIGGAPLGVWFAQQGSINIFLVIIFVYCFAMSHLEKKYNIKGN